ncbi:ABC transporter substrate-binding protein [Actinophytocola oryzae]|uniref:Iron complex transport system substrate-binding protein n=1 Tax=Actinophytocola oryzae TaxID=502181 RepID=A0A4R7VKG5_9PSEU|nr:Fe(3+) dicitrate ABC transporter substrate-binding protein [Actinophytocola oryzae]TDV49964.1 iron complex transport system substrate-binding protein [Actinophytocola oryzae]
MSLIPKPRWALSLVGIVITSAALAGCGSAGGATAGGPQTSGSAAAKDVGADANTEQCGKTSRTIKHDLGTTTVRGTPSRVVVLEFSFVDAVVNLGVKPVGIADDNDPDRLIPALKDKVGKYTPLGLRASPNLQVITSLKPDLILADSQDNAGIYAQLSKIAPTIAVASEAAGYQDTINSEKVVAQAMGKCEQMDTVLAHHEKVMQGFKNRVPKGEARKVLFAISTDTGVSGYTEGGFAPGVLAALGLRSPLPDTGGDAQVAMSLETMVSTRPDVLFVAPHPGKLLLDQWATTSLWDSIPAVAHDKVYKMNQNLWSRARGLTAAEEIAEQAVDKLYGAS